MAAWALVAVGGLVRVTESGLGCPDWPLCEGRVVPHGSTAPVIEYSHRAAAGLVTALVLLTALWSWRRYRSSRSLLVAALGAAVLVPFQAVLGAIVVWLELPAWIVGVHFVVGMLFLAATVLTAVAAWSPGVPARATGHFIGLATLSAGAGLVLVILGAAVVSTHADEACGGDWPGCNGGFVAGGGEAWLQVAHRTVAYAVAGLAVALALQAVRGHGPRLAGLAPLAAVAAQVPVGVALVLTGEASGAHEPLAALHVAGAGAVWVALVAVAALAGPPGGRAAPARAGARQLGPT